jgi:hypothetical protein
VKRSIEFACDPRWIKNPTNNPIATIGQRMAASARTKKAIAAVQAILDAHFMVPPGHCARLASNGTPIGEVKDLMRPNLWTVRLTRISPGTLDPLTGGSSMKVIQDAVARWCGVADERHPVWRWVEPIGQEKRGQGIYGVRIEIESLEPGADRVVRLAFPSPKKAARKPTVTDLRDAAERVLSKRIAPIGGPRGLAREIAVEQSTPRRQATSDRHAAPAGDPGEELAACMLVPCEVCGAPIGKPCRFFGGEVGKFKAHPQRAKAAGHRIEVGAAVDRKHFGPRKLAQQVPVQAWAVFPWAKRCGLCDGVLPDCCPGPGEPGKPFRPAAP